MNCSTRDCKKMGLATFGAFVVLNIADFLLHGVVLMSAYMDPRYAALWNPKDEMAGRRMPALAAYLVFCALFTKIYAQGYEPHRGFAGQGLRFGLAAGAMVYGMHAAISYMVYPVSGSLAAAWLLGGMVEGALMGLTVAAIYRPKPV